MLALGGTLLATLAHATVGESIRTDHVKARLLADVQSVAPG